MHVVSNRDDVAGRIGTDDHSGVFVSRVALEHVQFAVVERNRTNSH
jgi:hypothetical protein